MTALYIIDASGFLYRSYHAITSLTNSQGESTNALYGFIRSVNKLRKDFNPTHLVAVFDGPQGTKSRKALYSEYKANRTKMPDDLRYQIDWAQDFCRLNGIPMLNIPEVEADDTMGSIASWSSKEKVFDQIFLCTSDKDMAQLVDDKIKMLNVHKENLISGPKEVEEKFGVPPEKIIDLLAIMGDSSDNVPGLPGFGAKTAAQLLNQFGSLDYILKHPDEIPGKKKQETVRNEGDKARLSKQLVTIDLNVEIPQTASFFEIQTVDNSELKTFYKKMNFMTLLKETEEDTNLTSSPIEKNFEYSLVDDEDSLNRLIEMLSKQEQICIDTETTNIRPILAEPVGIGFCIEPAKAWYIPLNGNLGKKKVLEKIKPLLTNPKIGFYGHNIKYDYHVLANEGIKIANICFDTILASFLLNSHNRQHSLDVLTLDHFGKVKITTSELLGKGKEQKTMNEIPIAQVCEYCCEDVDYTCRLKLIFEKELEKRKLSKLYHTLELPLLKVLAKMERHGIYVDVPFLKAMAVEVNALLEESAKSIFDLAGENFNLNSPKQLSQILFEKIGITPPKKTATGFSTNAEVLESIKHEHPIAEKILEYRTLEKLRSTYIETLPLEVNPATKRIHCTFNQFVAATGRLSCQDPNLQNIPTRTPMGKKIREAFRPEKENYSFLAADYSQIELRLLAHFCEDPNLIDAFCRGEDIHAHTAATVFGVPIEKVTKEMRYRAKAVNFGIIYGQQAFGLARELGIDIKEAKAFIDTYFERFPKVLDFIETCKRKTRESGKAVTYTGRERFIPEINSRNPQIRNAAERLAVNTPLQGSAADLIKSAMLTIDKRLQKEGHLGYMLLQIHDELIFELPDFEIPALEALVKNTMENVLTLKVPLIVNISIGKNWKEC